MSDEGNHGDLRFLMGLFLGGLIGALVIFFLGTKEGRKAGKLLEEKGKDVLDDVEGQLEELEQKGKEIVKQGEKLKDQVVNEIEEKKEVIAQSTAEKLDTALAHIEELQEHGRDTTADLRRRLFKNIPKRR
ncbi:hypothetical protein A2Z00_01635 [Candidatus Gottesmanbacteria bacterium RBG_13_45_10]|uniref:Uncharacterized protein n=1 Tax=Candidatus Gottesmanbacteria bacterium RBG_13_45_10 TaxID=1798370 RepID=A0A1F5ZH81_9BACT|nr:MAG: hypothetical protein A2Z00_01635 [Candidatus Gottesmanbacteria bacterium RBG_13_45_10]